MAYKKKTPYFGIPIPSKGDKIQESEETIARNIIENQLLAGMKGVRCSVFEEGSFKLSDNNDGTYFVSLSKSSSLYAFCGIVGGAYSESEDPIIWDGLEIGCKYYLYITYAEGLFEDEHAFRLSFSTSKKTDTNGLFLLMACVDLIGTNKIIDSNPDGKIYSNDLAKHTTDTVNPHGEELTQDLLIIKKNLEIENNDDLSESSILLKENRTDLKKGKNPTIESTSELNLKDKRIEMLLSDENNKSLITENKTLIGAINESCGLKTKIVEIDSNGVNGLEISIEGAKIIEFVGYNQIQTGSKISFENIGNVIVGYFGQDETVKNVSSFKIYNNGETGLKLKLFVSFR